jgi:hypothetical protein
MHVNVYGKKDLVFLARIDICFKVFFIRFAESYKNKLCKTICSTFVFSPHTHNNLQLIFTQQSRAIVKKFCFIGSRRLEGLSVVPPFKSIAFLAITQESNKASIKTLNDLHIFNLSTWHMHLNK